MKVVSRSAVVTLLLSCPGYCASVEWMYPLQTLMAGRLFTLQHTGVKARPAAFWLNNCAIWKPAAMRWEPKIIKTFVTSQLALFFSRKNLNHDIWVENWNLTLLIQHHVLMFVMLSPLHVMNFVGSDTVWCSWWKCWGALGGALTKTSQCEKVFFFTWYCVHLLYVL